MSKFRVTHEISGKTLNTIKAIAAYTGKTEEEILSKAVNKAFAMELPEEQKPKKAKKSKAEKQGE